MLRTRATVLSAVVIGGLLATATPAFATEGDLVYEGDLEGAHVKVVETTDGEMWDVTVTNTTDAAVDFGLGVTTHDPSTIEYLWQSPWTYFADETHELVDPGQSYTHYLPAWPGVTMAFYRDAETNPVEIGRFPTPGNFVPFIVTGSEDTELSIEWGSTLQVANPFPRAGETVHVSADWVYASDVDLYLLTEQETIDSFGQGIADWSAIWGVPDGAVPFASLIGDGTRVEGDVTLPSGVDPGEYSIIAVDAATGASVAGPPEVAFMSGEADAHNLTIEPGAPRGAVDPSPDPVTVTPVDQYGNSPVTFTLPNVTGAGTLSVLTSASGPTPSGFSLNGSTYYELGSSAGFDGSATVCVSYDTSPWVEEDGLWEDLALFHFVDDDWVDITDHGASSFGQVCGVTDSFSPFTIGIPDLPFTTAPAPTITGSAAVGQTLTADPHTWAPAPVSFSYQWLRDGVAIDGATANTYPLTQADAGARIAVSVTGVRPHYIPAPQTSAATAIVTGGIWQHTVKPEITGAPAVGQYLYADPLLDQWVPSTATVRYQWVRAADNTTTGSSSSNRYTVRAADAGSTVYAIVTVSKPGFPTVTKQTDPVEIGKVLSPTPTPVLSTGKSVGATLIATAGAWDSHAALTYQWYRDGAPIDGAITSTYELGHADAGTTITVRVTGSAPHYTSVTKSSSGRAIERELVLTPAPTIQHDALTVGQTLTAVSGGWDGGVSLAYQWYRDDVAIGGAAARAQTYLLTNSDAGKTISVSVKGSLAGYTAVTRTSGPVVVLGRITVSGAPSIPGSKLLVGQTVTATTGTWGPAPVALTYQWFRGTEPIADATGTSYVVKAEDGGFSLSFAVTGAKDTYATEVRTSAPKPVEPALTSSVPTISGNLNYGQVLTANPGAWGPPAVQLTYQWKRNGSNIAGATSPTYTIPKASAGSAITVTVTGTLATYTTASRTSAPITVAPLITPGSLSIAGTAAVGSQLSTVSGAWSAEGPVTLRYQWFHDGSPIAGATNPTYVVAFEDAGHSVSVTVTGSSPGLTDETKSAAKTVLGAFAPIAAPTIGGSTAVGGVLTVTLPSFSTAPDSVTYQWQRNGVNFSNALGTYAVKNSDRGKVITVIVTAKKSGYSNGVSAVSAGVTIP